MIRKTYGTHVTLVLAGMFLISQIMVQAGENHEKKQSMIPADEGRVKLDESYVKGGMVQEKATPGHSISNDDEADRIVLAGSRNSKPIDITLTQGERKTHTATIENAGDTLLEWEISLQNEAGVLYRWRRAGKGVPAIGEADASGHSSKTIPSDELPKKTNAAGSKANVVETLSKASDAEDKFAISAPDLLSDAVLPSKQVSDESTAHLLAEAARKSVSSPDPAQPIQALWEWYRHLDCGCVKFEPKVDILEISDDNGEHWRQILPLGKCALVINADYLNPAGFIERFAMDGEKPDGYRAIFLDDLLDQVRCRSAGFTVEPRSGTVPANGSMEVELTYDANAFDDVVNATTIIVKAKGIQDTEIVVPILVTVIPSSKTESKPNEALKSGEPELEQLPIEYALYQNFPNPFNPSTTIRFDLPEESSITITMYDILGRTLFSRTEQLAAGSHRHQWDGRNGDGAQVASGVYFYRIEAQSLVGQRSLVAVRKMMLVR